MPLCKCDRTDWQGWQEKGLLSLLSSVGRARIGPVNGFRLFLGLLVLASTLPAKEPAVVQEDFQRTVRPVLQKFCFDCHGERKPKAGIRVDYLDGSMPDKEVRHWEIIRKQLIEEEMPPEDEAQPSKAERAAMVTWIDGALQMARTRVRPKNGGARRLTVAQYLSLIHI